jgi:hypothetical protein
MNTRLTTVGSSFARRVQRALTLVETMIAMTVFSLAMIGAIYSHLYGLKQDELVQSKLGASDESRHGWSLLCGDIRQAKGWVVGNGSGNSFTPIPNNTLMKGNAIRLYPTTTTNFVINTNIYVVYYFNTNTSRLLRRTDNVNSSVIASDLTNNMYFQAEDYRGTPLSVQTYRATIHTFMEFAQYQYPLTKVGSGSFYDYYKMEFRVTSHAPDGP